MRAGCRIRAPARPRRRAAGCRGERRREAVAALRAGERAVGVAVVGAGEDGDLRPARARASERRAVITASVPELQKVARSIPVSSQTSAATSPASRARPHLDAPPGCSSMASVTNGGR